jgi:hypothetical protein
MKIRCVMGSMLIGSAFLAPWLSAGNFDLEIHCVPRRVDQNVKSAADGHAAVTKEHWAYEVTIENKTFQTLGNLEVKYAIFFSQERLGAKASGTPERHTGEFTLPALASHEKKTLTTDSVELDKSHLVGNWIYRSGAKPNATGTLGGLWVRVYQNGQLFAEYANPTNLTTQQKWE